MTLAELEVGDSAVIIDIDTRPETKRRLMDIGLARGTVILVKRFAPLGDPVEIALKDFSLALRKSDAAHIFVESVRHAADDKRENGAEVPNNSPDRTEAAGKKISNNLYKRTEAAGAEVSRSHGDRTEAVGKKISNNLYERTEAAGKKISNNLYERTEAVGKKISNNLYERTEAAGAEVSRSHGDRTEAADGKREKGKIAWFRRSK